MLTEHQTKARRKAREYARGASGTHAPRTARTLARASASSAFSAHPELRAVYEDTDATGDWADDDSKIKEAV